MSIYLNPRAHGDFYVLSDAHLPPITPVEERIQELESWGMAMTLPSGQMIPLSFQAVKEAAELAGFERALLIGSQAIYLKFGEKVAPKGYQKGRDFDIILIPQNRFQLTMEEALDRVKIFINLLARKEVAGALIEDGKTGQAKEVAGVLPHLPIAYFHLGRVDLSLSLLDALDTSFRYTCEKHIFDILTGEFILFPDQEIADQDLVHGRLALCPPVLEKMVYYSIYQLIQGAIPKEGAFFDQIKLAGEPQTAVLDHFFRLHIQDEELSFLFYLQMLLLGTLQEGVSEILKKLESSPCPAELKDLKESLVQRGYAGIEELRKIGQILPTTPPLDEKGFDRRVFNQAESIERNEWGTRVGLNLAKERSRRLFLFIPSQEEVADVDYFLASKLFPNPGGYAFAQKGGDLLSSFQISSLIFNRFQAPYSRWEKFQIAKAGYQEVWAHPDRADPGGDLRGLLAPDGEAFFDQMIWPILQNLENPFESEKNLIVAILSKLKTRLENKPLNERDFLKVIDFLDQGAFLKIVKPVKLAALKSFFLSSKQDLKAFEPYLTRHLKKDRELPFIKFYLQVFCRLSKEGRGVTRRQGLSVVSEAFKHLDALGKKERYHLIRGALVFGDFALAASLPFPEDKKKVLERVFYQFLIDHPHEEQDASWFKGLRTLLKTFGEHPREVKEVAADLLLRQKEIEDLPLLKQWIEKEGIGEEKTFRNYLTYLRILKVYPTYFKWTYSLKECQDGVAEAIGTFEGKRLKRALLLIGKEEPDKAAGFFLLHGLKLKENDRYELASLFLKQFDQSLFSLFSTSPEKSYLAEAFFQQNNELSLSLLKVLDLTLWKSKSLQSLSLYLESKLDFEKPLPFFMRLLDLNLWKSDYKKKLLLHLAELGFKGRGDPLQYLSPRSIASLGSEVFLPCLLKFSKKGDIPSIKMLCELFDSLETFDEKEQKSLEGVCAIWEKKGIPDFLLAFIVDRLEKGSSIQASLLLLVVREDNFERLRPFFAGMGSLCLRVYLEYRLKNLDVNEAREIFLTFFKLSVKEKNQIVEELLPALADWIPEDVFSLFSKSLTGLKYTALKKVAFAFLNKKSVPIFPLLLIHKKDPKTFDLKALSDAIEEGRGNLARFLPSSEQEEMDAYYWQTLSFYSKPRVMFYVKVLPSSQEANFHKVFEDLGKKPGFFDSYYPQATCLINDAEEIFKAVEELEEEENKNTFSIWVHLLCQFKALGTEAFGEDQIEPIDQRGWEFFSGKREALFRGKTPLRSINLYHAFSFLRSRFTTEPLVLIETLFSKERLDFLREELSALFDAILSQGSKNRIEDINELGPKECLSTLASIAFEIFDKPFQSSLAILLEGLVFRSSKNIPWDLGYFYPVLAKKDGVEDPENLREFWNKVTQSTLSYWLEAHHNPSTKAMELLKTYQPGLFTQQLSELIVSRQRRFPSYCMDLDAVYMQAGFNHLFILSQIKEHLDHVKLSYGEANLRKYGFKFERTKHPPFQIGNTMMEKWLDEKEGTFFADSKENLQGLYVMLRLASKLDDRFQGAVEIGKTFKEFSDKVLPELYLVKNHDHSLCYDQLLSYSLLFHGVYLLANLEPTWDREFFEKKDLPSFFYRKTHWNVDLKQGLSEIQKWASTDLDPAERGGCFLALFLGIVGIFQSLPLKDYASGEFPEAYRAFKTLLAILLLKCSVLETKHDPRYTRQLPSLSFWLYRSLKKEFKALTGKEFKWDQEPLSFYESEINLDYLEKIVFAKKIK